MPKIMQGNLLIWSSSSVVERKFEELRAVGAIPTLTTKRVRVLSNRHYALVA